jgi:hypothetical protein
MDGNSRFRLGVFMNKRSLFLIPALSLAAMLSACGSGPSISEARAASITAAALTAVHGAEATPTPSPSAAESPSPEISPSHIPTATLNRTNTLPQAVVPSGCDNSAYVSDVTVPDGTVMEPGEKFTKTWKFKNTGSCDWTTSYTIAWFSGEIMKGATTPLTGTVEPGEEADVSVELVAPSTAGTYTGYWKLRNASEAFFGDPVYVQIVVTVETVTSTDTPTITPTPLPTDTPTEVPPENPEQPAE